MKSPKRGAMTLFEVTIVIIILGILATVTMPRLSNTVQAANVRSCAATIQSHLAYARSVAMSRGRTVTVVFENNDARYSCPDIGFPDQPGSSLQVNVRMMFDPSIALNASFDQGGTIAFDGEGMPRVGTVPLVHGTVDVSAAGVAHRVHVSPVLGTVSASQVN